LLEKALADESRRQGQSDLLETIRRRRYAAPDEIDSLVLLREDRGR
jgi:hypothetical protein